jgi:hypothetical protein
VIVPEQTNCAICLLGHIPELRNIWLSGGSCETCNHTRTRMPN